MSSRGEQNGRQPPLPTQPRPSQESQSQSVTDNSSSNDQPKQICRNYVWGTCHKGAQCKFRHELVFEEMKKILKFCHDYQNKNVCIREDCTYLHTTSDEENLFLTTGQIPRVLAERYSAMSAPSNSGNVETIPQIAHFIRESFVSASPAMPASSSLVPPAPPTPCPAPPCPAPPLIPAMPMIPAIPVQQLLPPPPPPTVPSTTIPRTSASVYTAPPLQNAPLIFPMSQPPPPLFAMFDATKPPPPIPNQIPSKNNAVKHKSPNSSVAGPSKIRKVEDTKGADKHCENCVQREIRIDIYRQEMDKIHCEDEYQSIVYQKKLEEYETGKEILRCLVSPELFRLLEELIEDIAHDILSECSQSSFSTGISRMPKQFILQLMDYVYGSSRNIMDSSLTPSRRLDETLLQSISSSRRTSSALNHTLPSDLFQAFIELLQNSNKSSDKPQSNNNDVNGIITSNGNNTGGNGFNRFTNGQKVDSSTSMSVSTSAVRQTSATVTVRPYPALCSVPSATPTSHVMVPPLPYPTYQPTVPPPPPSRPHYTHPFKATSNNTQSMQFNTTPSRASAPVTQLTPSRSSTSAAVPIHPDAQNCNQYVMGRYPPPHYYSPYQ